MPVTGSSPTFRIRFSLVLLCQVLPGLPGLFCQALPGLFCPALRSAQGSLSSGLTGPRRRGDRPRRCSHRAREVAGLATRREIYATASAFPAACSSTRPLLHFIGSFRLRPLLDAFPVLASRTGSRHVPVLLDAVP
eukprot:15825800-Heterocapsa_arctica.AAC.1